jgi:hypothetical protein
MFHQTHSRVAFTVLLLLFNSAAFGQNRDQKSPPSEDEMIARAAGRVTRVTTERDRLVRLVDRVTPSSAADKPSPSREFDDWFDRLSGDRSTWDRETITRRPLADVFDRMAERLNVSNGRMTRAQFHQYARKYLAEGSSPPWDSADDQTRSAADKTFDQLDLNHDGVLSGAEQSPALRATRGKWDADHDGTVSRTEYRAYFAGRIRETLADRTNGDATSDRTRPIVYRAGRLPPDLPDWFARLDTDGDGQVALYEWRESGWPIEDFQKLDRNDDGFLTADEVLWHVARAKEHDTPEKAILARHLRAISTAPSFGRGPKAERASAADADAKSPKQLKRDAKEERTDTKADRKDIRLKKKGDG